MKILAIEKENEGVKASDFESHLQDETKHVIKLIEKSIIREIYFDENKNAILILECENKDVAKEILGELPLVRNNLIEFNLLELNPYTGFSRLF